MPCACSLPATTTAPFQTEASTLICTLAAKNATPPRLGLHAQRALILAILFIMLISWPLLVCAEAAHAGLENYSESHDVQVMSELSAEVFSRDLTQEETGAGERPKFWNRKFLRGKKSGYDSTKELLLQVSGISGEERTLLHPHDDDFGIYSNTNRRMLIPANVCTNKDISISQGSDGSSGIPRYFVQIVNTCIFDCAPSQVHVYCGWFASALLVNPNTFRRLAYDDCLVNGGKPLKYGEIVRFTYANSFMYPIRFKSARFCR